MTSPARGGGDTSQLGLEFGLEPKLDHLLTPDEIFDSSHEALLRTLREDSRLERKPSGVHARLLGDYLSMWANTQPHGGIIVVGIADDTSFEGCSRLHQNQLNEIEKAAASHCPDAKMLTKRVEIHRDSDGETDFLLLILVPYHQTRVVQTSDGKVFRRVGDTKRRLRGEEIRQLREEKGEIRFEADPCGMVYPDGFDTNAIDEFSEAVRAARAWDASHSSERILEFMHLGKREGHRFIPNMACAILFARDPRSVIPGCRIRFLRFSGESARSGDSWNAVRDEVIEGGIASQIESAAQVIRAQLRTFSRLVGGKFVTSPEYPEDAWYEAVVNACVHRSYGNGMQTATIFVRMFDDRLEVESPGPFPPFVTPETIYELHLPRNPTLMEALRYLRFVKCAAEGAKRIRSEMLDMGLPPPEFGEKHTNSVTVRVVLRNNIKQRKMWVDSDVVELLGAQMAHALSESEKLFISFAAKNGGSISVSDAERLAHVTWETARKKLMALVDRGVFTHEHREDIPRDPKARFRLRGYSRE